MSLGVDTLPDLNKDSGDRNRTSSFAFTGNRSAFRAVGSSQSVAGPLVVLNTILADSLAWISKQLEAQALFSPQVDRSIAIAVSTLNQQLVSQCIALEASIGNPPHGTSAHLHHCAETLLPLMADIRSAVDGLERLVDDALWPLPTHQELLFVR